MFPVFSEENKTIHSIPFSISSSHFKNVFVNFSAYRVLVGKPEGRRPLERPRRRWENNIKIDL
jgi:hypothetical protein